MAAAAHPVRTLRELVNSLGAAITLVLADPKPRSIHDLRTGTRRIEAQLELLALLPDLPRHAKPAKKAGKLLREVRRAAGSVRDLDVQRDIVASKSKEAAKLRSLLKHRRSKAAEKLLHTLHKHQAKLACALESLLEVLAPAESLTIPVEHLVALTLDWYARRASSAGKQDNRRLHNIRKAAKLARYIAESAISTPTRNLARTFESLQQSGGDWHDWHTLSGIAHRELGKSSRLAQDFGRRCEKSLANYQSHLKSLPEKLSSS